MVAHERRYWFLEVLGTGGFGSVYRAELQGQGGFRKNVALKMLHPNRTSSAEVVRRLRDEARLLAHVSHPGIVQVDGLIQLRGQWTVVMEYVPGVSLQELVALGPVPILCAVQIVEKIAEALDAAHNATDGERRLDLVHRDIKPSNILLTPDGSVKLVDFGVALADPDLREARTDELFFGAPEYMAPERWEFRDTSAADVYSLGALFWELLTGELLGRTSSNEPRHRELVRDAIAQLGHIGNDQLIELVNRMVDYSPRQRPSARTVAMMCKKLEPNVPGPWLRDWAEREVPRARGRRPEIEGDPLLDVMLTESDSDDITTILPHTADLGRGRSVRLVALLAVAALAALTLWAVSTTKALREADDHASGQAVSAMVRTKAKPSAPSQPAAPAPADQPQAEPAPAPAPAAVSPRPRPAPPPPAEDPGTIMVQGDAEEVFLVGSGRRLPPGSVPPGSYTVEARFAGRGLVEAGQVVVSSGAQLTLTCDSGFALCKAQ
jgi:serine/threonine protein kinase